ncbi:MAG: tandem-95 repeat protein, partial [Ilumatobacter sp.]|nr:tandem-95 repeat protein [Ilumatobacter sp.]
QPVTTGAPTQITLASGAIVTMNGDGTYDYDPNGAFESLPVGQQATDAFTYQIDDGNGGLDTATVTITINGVNDAPVGVIGIGDQSSFDGGTSFSLPTAGAFSDPDGDSLSYSLAPDAPTWLQIDAITGVISVDGAIPSDASQGTNITGGADGHYDITVIATDPSGSTAEDTFQLSISNLLPVAQDDIADASEDGPALAGNVITDAATGDSDTAPDSDVLEILDANQAGTALTLGTPFTVAGGGELTLNADGSYTFNPGTAYNGLDDGETAVEVISYTVTDKEGGNDTATLTITIHGANDAPVIVDPADPGIDPTNPEPADPATVIPTQSVADGDDFSSTPLIDVSNYAIDPDEEPLTFTTTDTLPPGLTLNPDGTVTGVIDNAASQGGDNPVAAPGIYTIDVAVDDGDTTSLVTLTIDVSNPAPVAQDDGLTGDEDTVVTTSLFADNGNGADADPDGDTIVVSAINADPGLVGTAVAGSNGGTFSVQPDGTVTFDPGDDFNGLGAGETATTEITYTIDDGNGGTDTATVTFTVTGLNDGPIPVDPTQPPIDPLSPPPGVPFDPDAPFMPPTDPADYIPHQSGDDGAPVTDLDLTPYFGDPDAPDAVTLSLDPADLPPGLAFDPLTGVISGTPDPDASQGGDPLNPGTYIIPVTATDPSGATFTTNLTYTIANPAPVAQDDGLTGDEDTVVTTSLFADNGNGADA